MPLYLSFQMQQVIRENGALHMYEHDHEHFVGVHAAGKLVKPADCGHVIAALALNATHDLSSKFVSWDEDKLEPYRAKESHL